MVVVAQLCVYTESHWIVPLEWVSCMVCELYLNKPFFKNPYCVRFSHTYTKIGTIQGTLSRPLCKSDTHIYDTFHILSIVEAKKKLNTENISVGFAWGKNPATQLNFKCLYFGFISFYSNVSFKVKTKYCFQKLVWAFERHSLMPSSACG